MRKVLSFILITVSIGFVGCTSRQPQEWIGSGKKEIVVWHWLTDRERAFDELAKRSYLLDKKSTE